MSKGLVKRLFGMFGGTMVGVTGFGFNLQTFAEGATPVGTLDVLEAGKEYSIGSEAEFLQFGKLVNEGSVKGELKVEEKDGKNVETDTRATITLTTNIDLTEGKTYTNKYCDPAEFNTDGSFQNWKETGNGGGRYTPIGTTNKKFGAKFDGNGHEIKLTINVVAESGNAYAGVFGFVSGGEIKNLGVAAGSYVKATVSGSGISYAGGIVGYVSSGTISGCKNEGTVNGSPAGGIAGSAKDSEINESYNTGNVSGRNNAGGVVGDAFGMSTISDCYNVGEVSASGGKNAYAGGIIGDTSSGTITISNCYNTNSISACTSGSNSSAYAGGIEGHACGAISNCYNTGSVSANGGDWNYSGGITGDFYNEMAVSNCYNMGDVNAGGGSSVYAGGVAGNTNCSSDATINNCYNTGNISASNSDSSDYCVGEIVGSAGIYSGTLKVSSCYMISNAGKAVNKIEGTVIVDTTLIFANDIQTESFTAELNSNIVRAKSEVLGETKEVLGLSEDDEPTSLDDAKQKLEERLKTETIRPKKKKIQRVLDKIKRFEALPKDGEVFKYAFGRAPALWWEKAPSVELNLGHTRSGIGGEAGFYKNQSGVVTFKATPNPGYKISRIVTSGSKPIRPGTVVKTLPERVTVHFKKV